jgi:hypothetical protein
VTCWMTPDVDDAMTLGGVPHRLQGQPPFELTSVGPSSGRWVLLQLRFAVSRGGSCRYRGFPLGVVYISPLSSSLLAEFPVG